MTIQITHYSDVLCVWAYVSQVRMDELAKAHGNAISIDYRLYPVFGDALNKLDKAWADRGGRSAYSRHVHEVAAQFGHVDLPKELWLKNAPASSGPAHLYLSAIKLAEQAGTITKGNAQKMAWQFRLAFFTEQQNIAERSALREIISAQGLDLAAIDEQIDNGQAWALLCADMQQARDDNIQASPTLLFNEGRQRLTGNVGYRIIDVNIRELLERPVTGQSWC